MGQILSPTRSMEIPLPPATIDGCQSTASNRSAHWLNQTVEYQMKNETSHILYQEERFVGT